MRNAEAKALLRALGATVVAVRRERKLTQEKVAERLDVLPGYLRRIEKGQQNLTIESIVKLATALEVSAWDLLERTTRAVRIPSK